MTNGQLEISALDPLDHDTVDQWLELCQTVDDHDFANFETPSEAELLLGHMARPEEVRRLHWVGSVDGSVVSCAEARLYDADNTHLAGATVKVHPDHRRKGYARLLLGAIEDQARREERTTVVSWFLKPYEGSGVDGHAVGFAAAQGYGPTLETAVRRVDLLEVKEDRLDALYREALAKAEGYRIVSFPDPAPDEYAEGIAYLEGRMYTDMPLGDMDLQPAEITVEKVRARERQARRRGLLSLRTIAVHEETGTVAAMSQLETAPGDELIARQGDTIADPDHRGHRLGLLVKIANQRQLRSYRPRIRYVHTGNATVNDHMVAVNEAMGYRMLGMAECYQKELA
ncbi:GNAT family N-acetyltransferase [Salininema proteolyticum]|uniref:GNAT family N-acetyltransferase n=1 Tax=Salininema proteolyticum TaxID=1607685 RepID=A0ABV8TVI5_9ACTN